MTPRERMIFDLGETCGRAIRDGLPIAEVGDVLRFVVSRFEPQGVSSDGETYEHPCRICGSKRGEQCKGCQRHVLSHEPSRPQMTEQELYQATHALYQGVLVLRKQTDELVDAALEMPPTVELCVFTGKLGAVLDVLSTLEAAGAPIHDPDEEPHPLGD